MLAVARDGLEAAVTGRSPRFHPQEREGPLAEDLACFVTLYQGGALRGCIGMLAPNGSLAESTRAMALGAALRDPRFPAVTPDELASLELSVSVLSPPRPLTDVSEWKLGRDGLIVSQGARRGVLLPQVAAERGWDYETFVSHTCIKAGLAPDAHLDPETRVEVFSAEVYR